MTIAVKKSEVSRRGVLAGMGGMLLAAAIWATA